MTRLALLISGGGTTMSEIIKATQTQELSVEIACVIASTPQAGGLEKAKKLGISHKDILVISPTQYASITQFGEKIIHELQKRDVNGACCISHQILCT